jgi:hypothetical protein
VGVFILEGLFSHQLSPFGASDGKTGTWICFSPHNSMSPYQ